MKFRFNLVAGVIFLFTTVSLYASDTAIAFRDVSYSDVFELAKREKKPVMLYFHFDGCGACIEMEGSTFKDKVVAEHYNSNFVCLSVNTRKGEGIETNKIYKIQSHPTYLFVDEGGNIMHKMVGTFGPEQFMVHAQYAVNPTQQSVYLKRVYESGNRDPGFLYEYCYRMRDADELDSLTINEYLKTQSPDDLSSEKNIKFIYEFAIHRGVECMPVHSAAYAFMAANKGAFGQYFDMDQVDTRLMFITQREVYRAIERGDSAAFWENIERLKMYDGKLYDFKEVDGRITMWTTSRALVLGAKLTYYERMKNTVEYDKTLEQFIATIWDDHEALNSLAWSYFGRYDDAAKLERATRWAERSIALKSYYDNADTYAWLLFKLGKYEAALAQAEKAILLAKADNKDYSGTSDLVDRINEVKKIK